MAASPALPLPVSPAGRDNRHYPNTLKKSSRELRKYPAYRPRSGADWRALSYMLGGLIAGGALALVHHFLNVYLDGVPLDKAPIPQEWVFRIATVLAFLSKMFFVVTVGIAFVQEQWLSLHRKPLRVRDIDALMNVLGDITPFFTSSVWFKHWVLTMMAVISWTIPLAAVITPGSLSVLPVKNVEVMQLKVPQLAFDLYENSDPNNGWDDAYYLKRLIYNAASGSQLPTFQSQYQNQSYTLNFLGPALKCDEANASQTAAFGDTFNRGEAVGWTLSWISYAAWAGPPAGFNQTAKWGDWMLGWLNWTFPAMPKNMSLPITLDAFSSDGMHLTIASNQKANAASHGPYNLTDCILYNATYSVQFDFQFPNQKVTPTIFEYHNGLPYYDGWLVNQTLENLETAPNGSLIGDGDYIYPGPTTSLSVYGNMMDSLGDLMVGMQEGMLCSLPEGLGFQENHTMPTASQCQVINNSTQYFSKKDLLKIDWASSESIQAGMERMWINATLGLFLDPRYLKTEAQAELIPSTVTTYPITYVYNSRDLILSYALAFGAAVLCTLIGLNAVRKNNASYQNLFSTFLRATSGSGLDRLVDDYDRGADPLPREFGNTIVRTTRRQRFSVLGNTLPSSSSSSSVDISIEKPLPRIEVSREDGWI